ncbi:MAG TPA: PQQ-binding-like beta-propeller repeat protein [Burkholderiales bacterium]|nr:PQQ-binding-like beta-propeller repeat protein [Burkholderiales bacterium]
MRTLLFALVMFTAAVNGQSDPDGEALYKQHCAICHDAGVPRAAARSALEKLSPDSIRTTLDVGSMVQQAAALQPAQKDAIIAYLTRDSAPQPAVAVNSQCAPEKQTYSATLRTPHWTGWGNDVTQHRFQWDEQARLTPDQVSRLKLKWAFGYPSAQNAAAQPTIVNGRLFVGSANGNVYALDAATGCTHWTYNAEVPVRTAISIDEKTNTLYFGDQRTGVHAVNAVTGKGVWKTRLDGHPIVTITGAPTLSGGVLYVPMTGIEDAAAADPRYECCRLRGTLAALDAATGQVLWKSSTITDELKPTRKNSQGVQLWGPAGAGIWSSPTVDVKKQRVYVTTANSTTDPVAATSDAIIAFDMKSGKMLWSYQGTANDGYNLGCELPDPYRTNCPSANGPDFDFGSSAILVELARGHRALIAGQKSAVVHAIDPDADGKVLWKKQIGEGGKVGGVQWGPATDGKTVYVALSDAQLGVAPPGTPGAQAALGRNFIFDPKVGGGLFALDAATGETLWHTPHPGCPSDRPGCSPGQSAAVTVIPGVVFSGDIGGILRAYDAKTGRIIWNTDTKQNFKTVNGVAAHGGSLNGPGPVIVSGMLYVNSGYVHIGTAPGNVLLAYSVDGK